MSKLFVIGNGFDLAHNLKTKYEDFHQYLKIKYPDAKVYGYYNIPESKMWHDGSIYYNDKQTEFVMISDKNDKLLDFFVFPKHTVRN